MVDDIFDNGTQDERAEMFLKLNNPYPDTAKGDFMYYVADIFTGRVQRGARIDMC